MNYRPLANPMIGPDGMLPAESVNGPPVMAQGVGQYSVATSQGFVDGTAVTQSYGGGASGGEAYHVGQGPAVSQGYTAEAAMGAGYGGEAAVYNQTEFVEVKNLMVDGGDQFGVSAVAFDAQEELLWMGNQGVRKKSKSIDWDQNSEIPTRILLKLLILNGIYFETTLYWSGVIHKELLDCSRNSSRSVL